MAREMRATWMPIEGLTASPAPVAGRVSGQGHTATVQTNRSDAAKRSWIPSLDHMPPLIQFALHAMQWVRSRSASGTKQGAQLRLVGQLNLGAKRHVSVVEIGGLQFLVGGGSEHVTVIVPIAAAAVSQPNSHAKDEVQEQRP
jgi:flagellar biogenesis protein FliO